MTIETTFVVLIVDAMAEETLNLKFRIVVVVVVRVEEKLHREKDIASGVCPCYDNFKEYFCLSL